MRLLLSVCVCGLLFAGCGNAPDTHSNSRNTESDTSFFPALSTAFHPTQHADPRRSDFIETAAPDNPSKQWEALTDSMIAQPCASGPENGSNVMNRPHPPQRYKFAFPAAQRTSGGTLIWDGRLT